MVKPLSRPKRPPEQLALDLSPATNLSMASSMPAPAVAVVGGTFCCDGMLRFPRGHWVAALRARPAGSFVIITRRLSAAADRAAERRA